MCAARTQYLLCCTIGAIVGAKNARTCSYVCVELQGDAMIICVMYTTIITIGVHVTNEHGLMWRYVCGGVG
jgi:hypothetical protein